MKKVLESSLVIIFILLATPVFALTPAQESNNDPLVRIKDITRVQGVNTQQLIGYGLVVGLNGTGDGGSAQTIQSVANMLQNFGINVAPDDLNADNVASVMVTAEVPSFAKSGDEVDVTLSSIGGADSLQGGTLLMTPLLGPKREKVYAEAQGPVSIGGYNGGQGADQGQQNHPTVGRVPDGGIVKQESAGDYSARGQITLLLTEPDFTTARRVADVVNSHFGYNPQGSAYAKAKDPQTVAVEIPNNFQGQRVSFISRINQLEVRPDTKAKVVFNERTGTIVMGHNVRLSKVSVSHGDLTVTIATNQEGENNQQAPEQEEQNQANPNQQQEDEAGEEQQTMVIPKGSTISDVVKALNGVGANPRDIIAILQAINQAGALHADLEIM